MLEKRLIKKLEEELLKGDICDVPKYRIIYWSGKMKLTMFVNSLGNGNLAENIST